MTQPYGVPPQNPPRILVASGDAAAAGSLVSYLRRMGFGVETALDESAARELLATTPEAIVLDLHLPGAGGAAGFALLAWLRSRPDLYGLPVVVYLPDENPATFQKALEAGATVCLQKSQPPEFLYAHLTRLLNFIPPPPPQNYYGAPGSMPPPQQQPMGYPQQPQAFTPHAPAPPGAVPYPYTQQPAYPTPAPPPQSWGYPQQQPGPYPPQQGAGWAPPPQPPPPGIVTGPAALGVEPMPGAPQTSDAKDEPVSILLADDSPDERFAMAVRLRRKGYTVLEATDGREALSLAADKKPDIILTDVHMPGMTGIHLAQRVHSDPKLSKIPVFLMSGLAQSISKMQIKNASATGFFEKPLDLNLLTALLENVRRQKPSGGTFAEEAMKKLDEIF